MPQPPAYTIATDFSADEAGSLSGRSTVRTTNLDTELINIKAFVDQMRTNVALSQADDGSPKDDWVDLASLADDVITWVSTNGNGWYATDTGTVNTMVVTLDPAATALTNGMFVVTDIKLTNTATAVTLNVNGLGAKVVVTNGAGTVPAIGALTIGTFYGFQYDLSADKFQIVFSGDSIAHSVAAEASAAAAAASATAAAASYDSFDDRYLGTKSSDPSVDNDGATLLDGALYFNTSTNVMMVYDLGGTTWNRTTPTSADQTKINTVSGIAANVTTVAGISSNVTTCAGISSAISTVAADASDIGAVAADSADIGAVAAKATEIGRLGTADAVADMAILATTDIVADMAILGTSDIVADMAILGTADVVTDMNVLATADVVTDMNVLATADVVTDMNVLGTADVVTDMNTLGTADVVNDMNVLGTSGNVTNMNTLSGISSDITTVAGKATEIGRLGTADAVSDMNTLGTADVVTDMNTLGTADVVSDMNTLGTGANVTAMATCATNEASINRYSDEYTINSSVPGSPNEGDLWFDSSSGGATSKILLVHNGTSFVAVTSSSAGILSVAADSSPQLGGDLDLQTYTLSNVSLANGGFYSNPNTITADATVTTAALTNMFLMGQITINDTYTWSIAGDGVLQII